MKSIKLSEKICCDDIIRCIYEFNDLDLKVYKELKKIGESRVNLLAKKLNKERSTIYRSLQRLQSCGLCIKKINKIKSGGYYHTYICCDGKIIKKKLERCIDNWYDVMKNTISDFDI